MIDIDKILFRASSIGDLMGVKGLGDTGKRKAIYTYLEYKYGRVKEFKSKYTDKGNQNEQDGIQILSDMFGVQLEKNDVRESNDYFTGECDIIGDDCIWDVKNSWDLFTFHDSRIKPNLIYEYQLRCYMELYNTSKSKLAYILTDASDGLVLDELRRESYNHPEQETPEWREVQIITSMIFTQKNFERFLNMRGLGGGDETTDRLIATYRPIPIEERVNIINYTADNGIVKNMETRVTDARTYLKSLYKTL